MFSAIFKKEVFPWVALASSDIALTVAGQGGQSSTDDFRFRKITAKNVEQSDSKKALMDILMKYEGNQVTMRHYARCVRSSFILEYACFHPHLAHS